MPWFTPQSFPYFLNHYSITYQLINWIMHSFPCLLHQIMCSLYMHSFFITNMDQDTMLLGASNEEMRKTMSLPLGSSWWKGWTLGFDKLFSGPGGGKHWGAEKKKSLAASGGDVTVWFELGLQQELILWRTEQREAQVFMMEIRGRGLQAGEAKVWGSTPSLEDCE